MSPLPVPYFVYGTVTSNRGVNVSNASITISGNSSETYATDTTDAVGNYQTNIQEYASYDDTIKVIATYNNITSYDTFTLTLGDLPKNIDLTLSLVSPISINYVKDKYVKINYVKGKEFKIC